MKQALTTGLELAGMALVVVGVWMIFIPAAFIVAGACSLALAYGASR